MIYNDNREIVFMSQHSYGKNDVFHNITTENRKDDNTVSVYSWISSFRDLVEMREIFLNMDRAMKYIHEHGYCIGSFDPNEIDILNNSLDQIRFNNLVKMPSDYSERRKIIKDDIYNSSFVQIGIYSKCLLYLKRDFLKQHFDDFSIFLPEGDVPYYRGVIERGASVYFCEYATERANRDLIALESELSQEDGMVKPSSSIKKIANNGVNDRINANIYKQISGGMRDAAFIRTLIYPTILFIVGVIFALLFLAINLV